jgi:hypothetical protein
VLKQSRKLKNLYKLATLSVFSLLAACGGGEDDPGPQAVETGPNLLACGLAVVTGGDTDTWCSGSGGSDGTSGSGDSTPPPTAPPTNSGTIYLLVHNEVEPNNQIASANPVGWGSRKAADDGVGWIMNGTSHDIDDQVDAFTFVAERTMYFRIFLCPESGSECERSTGDHDPITVFFRVLDQDGNVLETTQGGGLGHNNIRIQINAGVVYYVTVMAGDTMGAAVEYNLRMYESR